MSDQVTQGAAHVRSLGCSGRRGDKLIMCSGSRTFSEAGVLTSPRLLPKAKDEDISTQWADL